MLDIKEIEGHIDYVLPGTDFTNLGEKKVGKVRDVYVQSDKIILVATDRYSAFDRNLALIPHKGAVLTGTSMFWFDATKDIIQNHVLEYPDPNVVIAKKCSVIPIEVIVRGYITGVTGTALWTLYQKGERDFGSFVLPEGMKKNQKLDTPVITPTTKDEVHDRPLTEKEIVDEGHVREELWNEIRTTALKLFVRGQEVAAEHGLILVDTKYEFGLDENGKLTLIDEIHTPDSSRYWKLATYDERMAAGEEPEYFDKEFLRLWFKNNCDPYNDTALPSAPANLVAELSRRYIEIYETMTGKTFTADFNDPIGARIEKNLSKYQI